MKEDLLLKQIKTTTDPHDAIVLLAELTAQTKSEQDGVNKALMKSQQEILELMAGKTGDPLSRKHSVHGRLECLEASQMIVNSHEKLLRGDPEDPDDTGLIADVRESKRFVQSMKRILWLIVSALIPMLVGLGLVLFKLYG